ncbi:MAG: SpoIIE family protein phosphatase [Pyrinomonadaceae bacterium]
MRISKIVPHAFLLFVFLLFSPIYLCAQNAEVFLLTADKLVDEQVELNKLGWLYRAGDDLSWAARDVDESAWERTVGTSINRNALPRGGWQGRAWFRLRLQVDETVADRTFALTGRQTGASEIYLDGRLLVRFGEINDRDETEYNPSRLPVPFKFDGAGEHQLAVRYSSAAMKDLTSGRGAWLARGGMRPGFSFALVDASDVNGTIQSYANMASMRIGFLFVGVLLALALLHFLLFVFYRAERANLFYSIYAVASALSLVCGNFLTFGHQGATANALLIIVASLAGAVLFVSLLAFLHVAFRRPFGFMFWIIAAMWALSFLINVVFLNNAGWFRLVPSVAIFLSFSFSIYLLVQALRERQAGARILMGGVQVFSLGMFGLLLTQLRILSLPVDYYFLVELALILGVPVSVSVFLARNFARTNRNLEEQLAQVKQLSLRQIEQERHAAILSAENERRAQELEEARQLQLSMLPKTLPQLPNLEIAAYMKPATEVGGDYYDFYLADDGTLTVAVGDATGHGLKAGTMVTAMKSLFGTLAPQDDLSFIFSESNRVLKEMKMRGLFMALLMLKVRGNSLIVCSAGIPPMLVYRAETNTVEEISLKAVPLGSMTGALFAQQEMKLAAGDCVMVMSDGFPERFNGQSEMLGYDKAARVLLASAHAAPQTIVDDFVKAGDEWAGGRALDDDVTFVVLKVRDGNGN